jgi:hypothetical protein
MAETLPIDLTPANMQMYMQTAIALCREELGRTPDYWNPDDTVVADLLLQALRGGTAETMRAWLQASAEWQARHNQPVAIAETEEIIDSDAIGITEQEPER